MFKKRILALAPAKILKKSRLLPGLETRRREDINQMMRVTILTTRLKRPRTNTLRNVRMP